MRLIENADRKKNKIIDSAPFPSTDVDKVSVAVKRARHLGLLPYVGDLLK